MKRPLPLLIAVLAAMVTLGPAWAGTPLEARLQAAVDGFAAANLQAPGVVVHVTCPPLGLDTDFTAGRADRGPDAPLLTARHTFRIASNTKTYVAAAVLQLVAAGEFDLDTPLAAVLPARHREALAADGYDLAAMTLAQVLSHTSGLSEHPADPRYAEAIEADPQREWTRDEQVRLCVEWRDPESAPGEAFHYSDTGYILLGGLIEERTGLSLGAAVHRLLGYEALGLDATWWERDEAPPGGAGPRAHQYYGDLDTTGWNPTLDLYGGGGLICDADDLGRFLRALVTGRVLSPEMTVAMLGRGALNYRLGLFREDFAGRLAWGHTGFWNTFAYHVETLDLTVSGAVLNHHATRGRELAAALVAEVAAASGGERPAGN
ncbi:beta-lactamase family protein [bacterium]|nr:beta-lactamase family protein [bacterium]